MHGATRHSPADRCQIDTRLVKGSRRRGKKTPVHRRLPRRRGRRAGRHRGRADHFGARGDHRHRAEARAEPAGRRHLGHRIRRQADPRAGLHRQHRHRGDDARAHLHDAECRIERHQLLPARRRSERLRRCQREPGRGVRRRRLPARFRRPELPALRPASASRCCAGRRERCSAATRPAGSCTSSASGPRTSSTATSTCTVGSTTRSRRKARSAARSATRSRAACPPR